MKVQSTKHSLVPAIVAAVALLLHSGAFAIGPTYSGSWYNPEQSGHGFSLEYAVLNDGTPTVVAYWYVYDIEGNPIFLVGQGEPEEGNTVTLEFVAPHGMKFGEFDPEQTVREDGGTGVFTFESEESGVFDYQPSGWIASTYGLSAITSSMIKLIGVAHPNLDPPPTGEPTHLMGLWSGRMTYDRDYPGNGNCYDADVLMNVGYYNKLPAIIDITVDRDSGSTSSSDFPGFIHNNYVTSTLYTFGTQAEYSHRFYDSGLAEGSWRQKTGGDCYGTWSFYRE